VVELHEVKNNMKSRLFIGIDIGGTKISGGLADETGKIIVRDKIATPLDAKPSEILFIVTKLINSLSSGSKIVAKNIAGIGIGVPGIVNTKKGKIVATPNVDLAGFDLVKKITKKFRTRVSIGNDVNLGLLGEYWFGAGRRVKNIIGLFPGTGVGGAAIVDGKLLLGAKGAATEFGHLIIDTHGPECSCGNRGCLEAIAGRWAIERDIRAAVKAGRESALIDICKSDLAVIKSKALKEALARKDELTTEVMEKAADALGFACVSLRHAFDPALIIFGGGIIEACAGFILPMVRKIVDDDPFFAKVSRCKIVESELKDDAVILGAVALAQEGLGIKAGEIKANPSVCMVLKDDSVLIDGKTYNRGVCIRVNCKVKKRPKKFSEEKEISEQELRKFCKKKPEVFIIAYRDALPVLSEQAQIFLKEKKINAKILPLSPAIDLYNETTSKKAILVI
jgi:glucokinase